MFELPGPWIEGVNLYDVHRMRRQLIDRFGREVNIGNVAPDDLFALHSVAWQVTTVFFAVMDLVAAVGLWLAATWGAVIWLMSVPAHRLRLDT